MFMGKFKRILLVEDDPKDIELTLAALGDYRLTNEIVVAKDGIEALEYLHRQGTFANRPEGNPVLVMLDIKMPRMDGIEVLRQIKTDRLLQKIPVVIMTSSRESQDLEQCYMLGANAYVVKPVRFADFVEAVKQIGAFWTLLNEAPSDNVEKA